MITAGYHREGQPLEGECGADGNPVPIPFETSHQGLAAGGFRAAARDLAKLMVNLDGKYTDAQLDSMGWDKGGDGKLAHNGRTGGGMGYAVVYPDG